MGFYWKNGGDQLYVKVAQNEQGMSNISAEGKPWTVIDMDLREPAPMPEPLEFARFLTTCLGFTSSLRNLSMYFDSHVSSVAVRQCSHQLIRDLPARSSSASVRLSRQNDPSLSSPTSPHTRP